MNRRDFLQQAGLAVVFGTATSLSTEQEAKAAELKPATFSGAATRELEFWLLDTGRGELDRDLDMAVRKRLKELE